MSMTEHAGQLVVIIMGLIVLGLLAYFLAFRVAPETGAAEWTTSCASSVRAHALYGFSSVAQRPPISCPPLDVTITAKLTTERGQQEAKKRLADAMYDCWHTIYRDGTYDLFEGETVYCAPCAIVRFTDTHSYLRGFSTYLAETAAPGRGISYLDVFAGYEAPHFKELVNDPALYNKKDPHLEKQIDSTDTYGVVFIYVKGQRTLEEWASALGTKPAVLQFTSGVIEGGALVTGVILFLGSNPVGWLSLGAIATGSLIVGGARALVEVFREKPQAWLATINLVEWHEGALQELGCRDLPVQVAPPR